MGWADQRRETPAARSAVRSRTAATAASRSGGLGEAADEGGADDDAVGETGDLGRLVAVADAEADRDRQGGVLADPAHQRAGAEFTASLVPVMPIRLTA